MIEHTLSLLDSPASLEAYLVKEGRCHLGLDGIQSQYFNVIGPLLFSAIAPYILVSIREYLIKVSGYIKFQLLKRNGFTSSFSSFDAPCGPSMMKQPGTLHGKFSIDFKSYPKSVVFTVLNWLCIGQGTVGTAVESSPKRKSWLVLLWQTFRLD